MTKTITSRSAGTALAAALLAAGMTMAQVPARAADIVVDDSRCHVLKAEDLATLEKKLKEAKAIAADDKLVCNGGPKTAITEQNVLGAVLTALGVEFCKDKNLQEQEKCAKLDSDGKRSECKAAEQKRFLGVFKLCE